MSTRERADWGVASRCGRTGEGAARLLVVAERLATKVGSEAAEDVQRRRRRPAVRVRVRVGVRVRTRTFPFLLQDLILSVS